jgi:fatty acid CoA ligase FadD9
MSTLFEDIRLVRPTRLLLVPRVSGVIYGDYQTEVLHGAPRDDATRGPRPGSSPSTNAS